MPETSLKHPSSRNILYHNLLSYNLKDEGSFLQNLGIGSFRGVIAGAPDVNDVDISPLGYATFLYDDQGTQIRQLSAPTSNRLPVSLDQIPVSLQHAVVAIEDERFYEHNGIDVRGIARAGMKAITTAFILPRAPARSHSSS